MNADQSTTVSLQDVVQSNIESKYFSDYGRVTAVYQTGGIVTTVDLTLAATAFIKNGLNQPNNVYGIEVLYPATAGLSFEIPVAVGDGMLLVGTRTLIESVSSVSSAPTNPTMNTMYSKETFKAIPLSSLKSSSTMYMRVKDGKLQVKNATKSLFTALDNFEAAVISVNNAVTTFSSATSTASLTAAGASAPTLATALNLLLTTMNASLVSAGTSLSTAKTDLAGILEA